MKIAGIGLIYSFIKQYPNSKGWLENWISDVKGASWKTSHEVKARYASSSFLPKNIVIFNVCGNNYRLEVVVAYKTGNVIATWIGTHTEYTRRIRAARSL